MIWNHLTTSYRYFLWSRHSFFNFLFLHRHKCHIYLMKNSTFKSLISGKLILWFDFLYKHKLEFPFCDYTHTQTISNIPPKYKPNTWQVSKIFIFPKITKQGHRHMKKKMYYLWWRLRDMFWDFQVLRTLVASTPRTKKREWNSRLS